MDRLLRTLNRGSRSRQDVARDVLPRLVAAVSLAAGLCAAAAACPRSAAAPPLSHTFESPERLASAVVEALRERDAAGLKALAISETEFRRLVWPSLPAARSEGHVPFGFVWAQLQRRSQAQLAATIAAHGGRDLHVRGVRFHGDTTDHGAFVIRRKAVVLVVDSGGAERELRLFGSVLSSDGRHKLFSYVVD